MTSTSLVLLLIGLLAGFAAYAVSPTTGFPRDPSPSRISVQFGSPADVARGRVQADITMSVVPEGATNTTCIDALRVRTYGDAIQRNPGAWALTLPLLEDFDLFRALPGPPDDVANDRELFLYSTRTDEEADPQNFAVQRNRAELRVTPRRSAFTAGTSDLTFVARPVDNPVGGPNCFGPDSFLSVRGANLQFTAPSLTVDFSTDPDRTTSTTPPPSEIAANYRLDGIEGFKVEIGDEPAVDRGSLDLWGWSYSSSATPERYRVNQVDGVVYSYDIDGPVAAAHSLSAESTEDSNTFISGVLLGIAAAGLVGFLQETLNVRRARRATVPEGASSVETFLFERSDAVEPATAQRGRIAGGVVLAASLISLAAIAIDTNWAALVQPAVLYPALTRVLGTTGALGRAPIGTLLRRALLLVSVMTAARIVVQQFSRSAIDSPVVDLVRSATYDVALPLLLLGIAVKCLTARRWATPWRVLLSVVLVLDALSHWSDGIEVFVTSLAGYAIIGAVCMLLLGRLREPGVNTGTGARTQGGSER